MDGSKVSDSMASADSLILLLDLSRIADLQEF